MPQCIASHLAYQRPNRTIIRVSSAPAAIYLCVNIPVDPHAKHSINTTPTFSVLSFMQQKTESNNVSCKSNIIAQFFCTSLAPDRLQVNNYNPVLPSWRFTSTPLWLTSARSVSVFDLTIPDPSHCPRYTDPGRLGRVGLRFKLRVGRVGSGCGSVAQSCGWVIAVNQLWLVGTDIE